MFGASSRCLFKRLREACAAVAAVLATCSPLVQAQGARGTGSLEGEVRVAKSVG